MADRQVLESNALDELQLLIRTPSVNPNVVPEVYSTRRRPQTGATAGKSQHFDIDRT